MYYRTDSLIIFLRLIVDALLNAVGVVFTLGLAAGLRQKMAVYMQIIKWHFFSRAKDRNGISP